MITSRKLQISAVADAVVNQSLDLITHHRFADEPWLASTLNSVRIVCQDNHDFWETDSAIQPFFDYFALWHSSATQDGIRQFIILLKTAINSGYLIFATEQKLSWAFVPEQPSAEAETLLAVVSEGLEREVQRKWGDPHTGRLRTVALMYGFILGRNGLDATLRSIPGHYHNRWVLTGAN